MSRPGRDGSLERGLTILDHVAAHPGVSPNELVRAVGFSRSAVYRIVDILRKHRYLEHSGDGLRLGTAAVGLGAIALANSTLLKLAPAHLRRLSQDLDESVFLAIAEDRSIVYVYEETGTRPIKMWSMVGKRRPLHCTGLGKAYLSALPAEERAAVVGELSLQRLTPTTITDPGKLLADVEAAAQRGFAIDDAEGEPGIRCIAAPIRDYRGEPTAVMSVGGPAERIESTQDAIADAVCTTAAEISRRLGHISTER